MGAMAGCGLGANEGNDLAHEAGAVGAPVLGAAKELHAVVEAMDFDLPRGRFKDFAQALVEEVEENELIACTGSAGEFGKGERDWRGERFEAAGDIRIAYDLQHGLDGFFQAGDGDDVFLEFLLEVAGDAFGDMGGEPPFFVAGDLGGTHDGGGQPSAVVVHHAAILKAHERVVVTEGYHFLKSSVWPGVRATRRPRDSISSMKSPTS